MSNMTNMGYFLLIKISSQFKEKSGKKRRLAALLACTTHKNPKRSEFTVNYTHIKFSTDRLLKSKIVY